MTENTDKDIGLVGLNIGKKQLMDLWFHDSIEFGHGCCLYVKIKKVLHQVRSRYQEIVVLETEKMGKMLVIDGITMLTEFDEAAYHEMIAHVPLLAHSKPSRVLVIGGGDGGVVREVLKHPEVESVHVCEIDQAVIDVCREHLPALASSFDDPKVSVYYEDGAQFVARCSEGYEIIIVDSTDPLGPGQVLFQKEFYANMKKALSPRGIAVTQCESIYLHGDIIRGVFSFAKKLYPKLGYYTTMVPTYPSGLIGFFFCSLYSDPLRDFDRERALRLRDLRYYTPQIHEAAFCLPKFAEEYFSMGAS
ncbi:MAG: polyamine aminopropyltransferase [Pseudomonadota bacterium]